MRCERDIHKNNRAIDFYEAERAVYQSLRNVDDGSGSDNMLFTLLTQEKLYLRPEISDIPRVPTHEAGKLVEVMGVRFLFHDPRPVNKVPPNGKFLTWEEAVIAHAGRELADLYRLFNEILSVFVKHVSPFLFNRDFTVSSRTWSTWGNNRFLTTPPIYSLVDTSTYGC
jgi:hypothetical protein